MQQKKIKLMIVLLSATLIWALIFWIPEIGTGAARLIYGNPLTHTLSSAYDDFRSTLLCVLFSFANLVYAGLALFDTAQAKKYQPERAEDNLTAYWVYTFVSLGALVIHCFGFHYVFSMLIAL